MTGGWRLDVTISLVGGGLAKATRVLLHCATQLDPLKYPSMLRDIFDCLLYVDVKLWVSELARVCNEKENAAVEKKF